MRILLPPSEAKHPGGRGRSLTRRPGTAPIDEPRHQVMAALDELTRLPPERAAAMLLLPPSVVAEAIAQNRAAASAPTLPAVRRYAGVVYDGLDHRSLTPAAQKLAGRELLIFSGLFGVVAGAEPIPPYRVPAKATLPGIGVAGTFWRPRLAELLPSMLGRGLILDLRSSDYAAMWQPPAALAHRTVTVRILSRRPDGSFGVISYPSKHAKGRLTAALLERRAAGLAVDSADDVAAAWLALGGAEATVAPARTGTALQLRQ